MQRLEAVVKVVKEFIAAQRVCGRRSVDELSWQGSRQAGRQAESSESSAGERQVAGNWSGEMLELAKHYNSLRH